MMVAGLAGSRDGPESVETCEQSAKKLARRNHRTDLQAEGNERSSSE
jgi:hypothetical protein